MRRKTKRTEEPRAKVKADKVETELTDTLAEGIAAAMAAQEDMLADEDAGAPAEMADLFLEELNRLWAEGPADKPAEAAA